MGDPRGRPQGSRAPLRVGCLDYVNVLPVVHCLDQALAATDRAPASPDLDVTFGSPEQLNALVARDRLDLSPVSAIEYARHQDEYRIVRDLCISSRGAVRSVVLFSRLAPSDLEGETVAICRATATSRVLLRVLLEKFMGVRPVYREHGTADDVDRGLVPAVLLIGDEALAYRLRLGNDPKVVAYDLGALWWEATGLPMVFAVWAVREGVHDTPAVRRFSEALLRSREMGTLLPPSLLEEAARRTGMSVENLVTYYRGLHFRLDDDAARGLLTFYRQAADLGLCPPCPRLRHLESGPEASAGLVLAEPALVEPVAAERGGGLS